MTTIAYCKGVMACDSAYASNDHMLLTKRSKIMRLSSGALWGGAGDDDDRALVELFDKIRYPRQFPSREAILKLTFPCDVLYVMPNGRIFNISAEEPEEHQTHWSGGIMEVAESYYAVGSGAAYALTAMECQRSAREAVEAAIRRDLNCRAPVHALPLIPPKKVNKRRKRS